VATPKSNEIHRVRRAEPRDHLRLALEAALGVIRQVALDRGTDQLDRRRSGQHAMACPPHLTHAAFAQLLLEAVAAQLTRALDLGAEAIDDARSHVGHDHHQR
jgi:hypothetical protein